MNSSLKPLFIEELVGQTLEYDCYICCESLVISNEINHNKPVRVCSCREYIHLGCLKRKIQTSKNFLFCEVCHCPYQLTTEMKNFVGPGIVDEKNRTQTIVLCLLLIFMILTILLLGILATR
jgi:hypothetical protein